MLGKRHPRKLFIAIAGIGFALVVAAAIFLAIAPMRARRIFAKAESIQIGKSTFSQARQVAEQFEVKRSSACSPVECEWVSGTSNFAVPSWWRGDGEAFIVRVRVKDGLVDSKNLFYWIGAGSTIASVSVMEKTDWPVTLTAQRWTKFGATQDMHYSVNVDLTPSDPAAIRKRYTSFNWNCLWQYQGCKDEHELMPTGGW